MMTPLKSLWELFLAPLLQRPKRLQMAALCHRSIGDRTEYLLVTSRDTARWIIPKGWPIKGLKAHETALREAWEEAGVRNSRAANTPVGSYTYQKRQSTGWAIPVETLVYSVAVEDLSEKYPESDERTRIWVDANAAAEMVDETELKTIFRNR